MKTLLFKILFLAFLIPLSGFASETKSAKYEKSSTVKKEFKVDANNLLTIKNKYGNVDIVTWDKNFISIEVVITVKGNSQSSVEKRLNDISIEFGQIAGEVTAKTLIEKSSINWSWWGSSNNVNYKINYTVKMPLTNNLNVSNDYGSISLDKLSGEATISCDYGSFNIGELRNGNNKISADYVSSSNIGFVNGATINTDYSKLTIEKANRINLNADYTSSQFGSVKNLKYSCDYGSLQVENTESIDGSGDYISLKIGTLSKYLNIKADYGSLKIENILKGFESIQVQTDYTSGMNFGFAADSQFNFIVNLDYAGFKYEGTNFNFNKKIVKSSSKYYEGYHGKNQGGGQVNINVSYGSVSFIEN